MQGYLYSRPVPAADLVKLLPKTGNPARRAADKTTGRGDVTQVRESAA
jgi:hypothetical protein